MHQSPHIVHSTQYYEDVAFHFERRQWNRQHPQLAEIARKFEDLVIFQPGISSLMRSVPMFRRHSDEHLGASGIMSAARAMQHWQRVEKFYAKDWPGIEDNINAAAGEYAPTRIGRYQAMCIALPDFGPSIQKSHDSLMQVIRSLQEMGFGYASFGPARERFWG